MDYEKKYKEALSKAKDMLSYKEVRREDMEYLFPELKESEDEKIKEALIQLVKCNERSGYFVLNNVSTGSMITWLEKQGEQKPAWSEEDELMFLSTIQSIEMTNGAAQLKIDWLKSLKERCTWKPDEEQLKAIKWIMDGDNPENWTVTLTKLYNDLKKL